MNAADTVELYRRWAQIEAHGSSGSYERLALAVTEDPTAVAFLETVEPAKRQPNLLFAALRWHDVDVDDPPAALSWLHAHPDAVREVMRTRRTQTNEIARCATLLPALAQLPEPIALIEVGASAGLCLLYDVWRYHYTGTGVDYWVGPADSPVTVSCAVDGPVPLPGAVPAIAWRVGLDLSPIDARDPDARRWLQCLVWPEHDDRARALRAALDVAAEVAPRIDRGDLIDDLPRLLREAPSDATVVVVHSATLSQVEPHRRTAFAALPARHGARRLGAEGVTALPRLAPQIPEGIDTNGRFVVSVDDAVLAVAHPHGRTLAWL